MFCNNCGREIDDRAIVCPNCGVIVNKQALATEQSQSNTFAIVGFIMSFFVAIVGLICSIIGLKKAPSLNNSGRGLAIAGIIISSLAIFFNALLILILIIGITSV